MSFAFTLEERVASSVIVGEVVIEDIRFYRDPKFSVELTEAEMTCKVERLFKGPKDARAFKLRVHILAKDVEYKGNKFLVFAFRLNDVLRAFDGQRGLVANGSGFLDYTAGLNPKTARRDRMLSYSQLISEMTPAGIPIWMVIGCSVCWWTSSGE